MLLKVFSCDTADWKKWVTLVFVCAVTFCADWSCIAALAILFIGTDRGKFRKQMLWLVLWSAVYGLVYFLFIDRVYGIIQLFTCLSIPLLRRYNGQLGRWKSMGKVFYAYYPAHLFLCGLLRILLWGAPGS